MQAVQAARELQFCALWAADDLHQFIVQFFVCCLQPFQVPVRIKRTRLIWHCRSIMQCA